MHMIQQFLCWIYIQRKQKHQFKQILAPQGSQQQYLQKTRYGSDRKCPVTQEQIKDIQQVYTRNICKPLKRIKFCHLQQQGQSQRISCLVKQVRERRILHLHMGSVKRNRRMYITKRKQTHRHREQRRGYQWAQGRGKGQRRDVG